MSGSEHCLSKKGYKVLRGMLEPVGVWFCPIETPEGVFQALRVPAIDVLSSGAEFAYHKSGEISGVRKLDFRPEAITHMFRVALPGGGEGRTTYITDELLTVALDARLKGFSAVRVWESAP